MNLEYQISLEYDQDRLRASWENTLKKVKLLFIPIRHFSAYLFLSSVGLITWGFIENNIEDSSLLINTGICALVSSIFFFFVYRPQQTKFLLSLQNRTLQKQWSEYYDQNVKVNIILNAEEFILKTNESEKAFRWKTLKSLNEYSTGFLIEFFNGYRKFIPKSAFQGAEQLEDFKHYISQVFGKNKVKQS